MVNCLTLLNKPVQLHWVTGLVVILKVKFKCCWQDKLNEIKVKRSDQVKPGLVAGLWHFSRPILLFTSIKLDCHSSLLETITNRLQWPDLDLIPPLTPSEMTSIIQEKPQDVITFSKNSRFHPCSLKDWPDGLLHLTNRKNEKYIPINTIKVVIVK